MVAGKKILLGITGSIAAYKTPFIVRELVKAGAEVKVVMTSASLDFVSKLTLSTLSKQTVHDQLFKEGAWANHVELGRWADLLLIAPLSCTTLSKMSSGLCDNLLMSIYFSATCPIIVAPAMDEDMWIHPVTKDNMNRIREHGCKVIQVKHGELASGLIGEGRMAEPGEIFSELQGFFARSQQLSGKKVLITAGPTQESIDPVRFISNHSSGKMGYAIAEEMAGRGAVVTLVTGPVSLRCYHKGIQLVKVKTAEEMFEACMSSSADYDVAVMAAAVADYTPLVTSEQKIKKEGPEMSVKLKKTSDILNSLGRIKSKHQRLIGFALETNNENQNAIKKLKDKNADMMVLNSLNNEGAGFGGDTNQVRLFFKSGQQKDIELKPKTEIAKDIVDAINELL